MGWPTVYLVVAILAGIIGIWNLAQQRNIFLALTGILWFLVVLFEQKIPAVSSLRLAGLPALGTIFLYVIIPVFIILAFFTNSSRR